MRHLRQAWAATANPGSGRFVHVFLPEDADDAHRLLVLMSRGTHQAAAAGEPSEYDHARLHDLVADGGFSHHPGHGAAPTSGFMASYHAPEGSGMAVVHDLAKTGPEHIAEHRQAIGEHLAKPDSYQGGWLDRTEDKVYLDASRHFEDEGHVRKFAVQQKQKAYFNLHDFSEKYLHPKLDPDAMKDEGAWRQKYAHLPEHERDNPPEGYNSFAHLYPATDEQKNHWAEKGHKISNRGGGQRTSDVQGRPAAVPVRLNPMAGRPVGAFRDPQYVEAELGRRHGR